MRGGVGGDGMAKRDGLVAGCGRHARRDGLGLVPGEARFCWRAGKAKVQL